MVKVNIAGCDTFVKAADYQKYVEKALAAYDVLRDENGAGNDFLGWKTLPVDIPESLIRDCETIRDEWAAKKIDLVVVIGIGGSYLGARCAIEALSHSFIQSDKAPRIVFAGNNLFHRRIVATFAISTVVFHRFVITTSDKCHRHQSRTY